MFSSLQTLSFLRWTGKKLWDRLKYKDDVEWIQEEKGLSKTYPSSFWFEHSSMGSWKITGQVGIWRKLICYVWPISALWWCCVVPVPSAPPENVSAEAVSSTQILLTWAAVPESEQNGLILGYKVCNWSFILIWFFSALPEQDVVFIIHLLGILIVQSQLEKIQEVCWLWKGWLVNVISFCTGWQGGISLSPVLMRQSLSFCVSPTFILQILYKAKDLDSEPKSQTVRGNHSQSVLLSGLRKFVLYELQVLAFTRIGDGVPSSPAVTERTKDDGEFKGCQNNHLIWSSLLMQISSSGASIGNKYLDFGGNFFSALNPKVTGWTWHITQQYPIGHGLRIWQKHRKPVSPIFLLPCS